MDDFKEGRERMRSEAGSVKHPGKIAWRAGVRQGSVGRRADCGVRGGRGIKDYGKERGMWKETEVEGMIKEI